MTALVINTMGTLESALRTLITGYAIATGKIKQQFIHNRTRQAFITKELIEIISGAESV